jgi:hypothetical protein
MNDLPLRPAADIGGVEDRLLPSGKSEISDEKH